jgi:hypothetical protein
MAHAKKEDLREFQTLLSELRSISALREKSHGCFYNKSKSVLHFHIKGPRLYAHVFDGKEWQEVDLVAPMSDREQKQTAKKIAQQLPLK